MNTTTKKSTREALERGAWLRGGMDRTEVCRWGRGGLTRTQKMEAGSSTTLSRHLPPQWKAVSPQSRAQATKGGEWIPWEGWGL